MTATTVQSVRLLADLLEPGDIVEPPDGEAGIVKRVVRARKRLRLTLIIELTDGRDFEIGATRFVSTPVE